MIFFRSHFGTRGFFKYYYLRLSVNDYVNTRKINKKVGKQEEKELNYRVVMIEKYKGRVAWKNGTGVYVTNGQILCDIISDNNEVYSIKAPISGLIANRFVDEGLYVNENSLICMLKVCARPTLSSHDREEYIFKKRLYSKILNEFEREESDERRELEKIFGEQKRVRVKDFITPTNKEDGEETLEHPKDEEVLARKKLVGIPEDVRDKRRKDEYEKYASQEIEMKDEHREKEEQIDYTNVEFYKTLIDENFTTVNKQQLQIVFGSKKSPKFLHLTTEINLTSALQFAFNEGERNQVKFELKFLILLGCLRGFKELPLLINSKDKSVNITVGIFGGGKLAFPMLKNLENDNFYNVKGKMLTMRASLLDGKVMDEDIEKRAEYESLAITNEWDYGCMTGPSCLYTSQHANLSLNAITIKPRILEDFKVHYLPMMSITLTFNNERIDGQDALLFLNKVKESMEQLLSSHS